MTAQKLRLLDRTLHRKYRASDLVGSGDHRYLVARYSEQYGSFFLIRMERYTSGEYAPRLYTTSRGDFGHVYFPVHEDVTVDDANQATYAWEEDGKWRFAHASPDQQIDFAAEVEQFAFGEFGEVTQKALIKLAGATNDAARSVAKAKADALVKFARAVGREAHRIIVGGTLGYWVRNDGDHKREQAVAALDSVLAAWKTAGLTDAAVRKERALVLHDATRVKTRLSSAHVIEGRAARAARLAAEAAAKEEASGSDGTAD